MFAKAVVKRGLKVKPTKSQLTLRVDRDVVAWFKSQGRGYQTQINALLRAYMLLLAREMTFWYNNQCHW
ncbi:MAG: BrnA antitoxin family protein [Chloroflexi bacterium]|nr:BrnA antitoxin family protein [Chloroflexota bacterium]